MFKDRVIIEWCEDVHIHFRNIRFELNEDDFLQLTATFSMARHRLWKWYGFPEFKKIKINDIEPYDEGHKKADNELGFDCGSQNSNLEHKEGIDFWYEKLKSGEIPPPILVKYEHKLNKYKRLDGFKRFMAMKKLGIVEIPCIVDNNSIPGDMENINWDYEKNNYCYQHIFSDKEPTKSKGERYEVLSEFNYNKQVPFKKITNRITG